MKTRIIWALIMLAVIIPVIAYANDIVFTILTTLITLIAMTELLNAVKRPPNITVLFIYGFILFSSWYSYQYGLLDSYYYIILFIVIVVLHVLKQDLERYNFTDASVVNMITLYVVFGFNAMINTRVNYDMKMFIYPIAIAVLADSFGYFGGRLFGKHKLIPNISPNKTIEGAISATLFASAFSIWFLQSMGYSVRVTIVVTVIMVILSQVGDLIASAIKRTYGIKDYSKLIPGHGGVMDRIDSILFNYIVLSVILIFI